MKFSSIIPLFAAMASAAPQNINDYGGPLVGAAYFLRVDPEGSSVVSVGSNAKGLLERHAVKTVSTQGKGLQAQNFSSPTLAPVGAAPLLGQGAVAVGDDWLFTVNSGSDTAVMFAIDSKNPTDLTTVDKPVATIGNFPMSVTYSSKWNLACVLTSGVSNGVTCYKVTSKGLIPDGHGLRAFKFPAHNPPQLGGPEGSGSDIIFDSESETLIASFKGTSSDAGHVAVFSVGSNGVSTKFVDNQLQDIIVPFGLAANGLSSKEFFVADPGVGGGHSVIRNANNTISIIETTNNSTLIAKCWTAYANSQYVTIDAGSPNLGVIGASAEQGLESIDNYAPALLGGFDGVIAGPGTEILYFLSHLNSIAVYNVKTATLMQRFPLYTTANRAFWSGMAHWPAPAFLQGGNGYGGWGGHGGD